MMDGQEMNVGGWIRKWGLLRPQKTALLFEDGSFTYRELNRRANQLCHLLLGMGIKKGDRVAVLLHNGHPYLEVLLALSKIGGLFVPLNWRLAGPEIEFILQDSGSQVLIFESEFTGTVAPLRSRPNLSVEAYLAVGDSGPVWAKGYEEGLFASPADEPSLLLPIRDEDPHMIMYTSGTTGVPKGAVLSHRKTFFNVLNAAIYYDLSSQDTVLVSRPLFHSGGLLVQALPALYKGATLILRRRFQSHEFLETIEKHRVTVVEMAGTVYQFILQQCDLTQYDLRSVRCYFTGGERISVAMLKEYSEKGIIISQIFGQTETSTLTYLPYGEAARKMGSVGLPVFHGELKIVDRTGQEVSSGEIGEIVVRGPIVMSGYWKQPGLTVKAIRKGWLHTGDLARKDEEGYIYIVDREKDMYISGGENVYPAEIEKIFFTHPKIFDVAIIGVPDERWGEVGKAIIVLKPGECMDPEEVLEFIRGKIAKYKMPKYVEFVEELPKTSSGKIQKNLLKMRPIGCTSPGPSAGHRINEQTSA